MGRRGIVLGTVLLHVGGAAACGGEGTNSSTPDAGSPSTPADAFLPLRFGALTERSADGGSDGAKTTAAVAGMNEFAIDLYQAILASEGGNVVVGPYSATFALSMVYAGARGATADEMANVLHATELDAAGWHEGINAYDLTLDARTAGSSTEWSSANKVWVVPGLALRDEYLDVLTGDYGSPVAELDFGSDPEEARQLINDWVDERTFELIPALWPEGSFSSETVMVLVNAVAMDAP